MTMLRYALSRLGMAIPILLISTFVTFLAVASSGDPLAELRERQPPVPEASILAEERRLGLDQGILVRYWHWLAGLFTGDFGPSVNPTMDIGVELATRVGVTFRFVIVAILIAVVLAVLTGAIAAIRQGGVFDTATSAAAFFFLSVPSFWLAVMLKQGGIAFNDAVGSRVIYTVGAESVPRADPGWPWIADVAGHLILPTISLALISYAAWSRFQRVAMIEVLDSDYVRLATAKGLPRRTVVRKYALRNALIPLVTVVAMDFTAVLSGAVISETVFQWRGMGDFLLSSIAARDVNAVMGWMLVAALAVVTFNFIADLLYGALDPRITHG